MEISFSSVHYTADRPASPDRYARPGKTAKRHFDDSTFRRIEISKERRNDETKKRRIERTPHTMWEKKQNLSAMVSPDKKR